MKVFLYVEGESGVRALTALFASWNERLRPNRRSICVLPQQSKAEMLKKIGSLAAYRLVQSNQDCVVAAPDLHPMRAFANSPFAHGNLDELRGLITRSVLRELADHYGLAGDHVSQCIQRFHATALKHDLEMLLLAARGALARHLRVQGSLGHWRQPVEDQNDERPPKYVVDELFRKHSPRRESYKPTKDAHAVLSKVQDLREILFDEQGRRQCPVFMEMLDWMGQQLGGAGY